MISENLGKSVKPYMQTPLSLPLVQFLGHMEVLKVLVVRPNLKLAWDTFKVVPPLFQHVDDCQHLLVMDFIVPLNRAEAFATELRDQFGDEWNWVPVLDCDRIQGSVALYKLE